MNEMLKALYDNFYEKLSATPLKAEIERCHQELIDKLEKYALECDLTFWAVEFCIWQINE